MTYDQVAEGEEATESPYVNFDAFFLRDLDGDGVAEGIRGTCRKIGEKDTLYIDFSVNTNGYLKDGKITINSDNFYLETVIPKENENGIIKENAISSNTKQILLRDVYNGTQKLLTGIVKAGGIERNINSYSKVNTIVLTGTHVADDGTETPVEKIVNLNIDWHGQVGVEIPYYFNGSYYLNQDKKLEGIVDEENQQVNLEFSVLSKETKQQLILNKSEIELDIPQLNGYNPISVEVKNNKFTYDEETRKLVITRIAETDEDGNITQNAYTGIYDKYKYNQYNVKVTYALEAYQSLGKETIEIKVPIQAYYEASNNPNEEFKNPYVSNIAKNTITVIFKKPTGTVDSVDITLGKYVSYPMYKYIISKDKVAKIYNGIAENDNTNNDTYTVSWYASIGTYSDTKGITLKETKNGEEQVSDVFVKKDGTTESMENFTKNIGLYFSNATSFLGEEGWIKVYDDETDELIETFTKDTWSKYTQYNPYKYTVPVKHIRIETSETINEKYFYAYNIKELDDEYITENYTKEEFDNISYIKSTLNVYREDYLIRTDIHSAYYEESQSYVNLSISNSAISTQVTQRNVNITITADGNENYNKANWLNGAFLLKLPGELINLKINSVRTSNSNVKISSYETYEENGDRFIKILTENETPTSYTITISCDMTPDPRIPTRTKDIELYASNEWCQNYYYLGTDQYDVNGNLNKEENVAKRTTTLSLVSPGSLLTSQLAKNYDKDGNEAIAPQIAIVSKEQRTATIEFGITNNYTSTISDVQILGKIPSKGNTYAITKRNMESEFDTKMKDTGIQLPEELIGKAKIYYSEKENATKDLADETNEWKETPEDWSKVKSFLININQYTMPIGQIHTFSYQIEIPENVEYNQISYSHHGIYFNLDTEEGKYRTQTEPNKLGFQISKQFNIELTKYQRGTDKVIPGVTFSIIEEESGEGNTRVTDKEGKLSLKNLYAGKTYIIKEIKGPAQYEINEEEIKFKTDGDTTGKLETTLVSGTLREGTELTTELTEEGYTAYFEVDDEIRPNIKITKFEQGTDIRLPKVKFKISGKGILGNGRILTTDENGEATLEGLYINEEYTLVETKAEGYYLANQIKFVIEHGNEGYTAKITEGTIRDINTTIDNYMPTTSLSIENEKIPRYTLEITKVEKGNKERLLEGAKFRLIKESKIIGEYTTDADGKITINDLYQYEGERGLEQTYTLKEVAAPAGYAKAKDITFKAQVIEGTLEFQEEVAEGATLKEYTTEGTTINVIIPDTPSFKLTKKDGTTKELLPGIKFAIYNIEGDEEVPATDSKGNIIGTKENIRGKEYYTLITNENGEFKADLPEGLYKAVEVEAPEQYDIDDNVYYFGIGASTEGSKEIKLQSVKDKIFRDIPLTESNAAYYANELEKVKELSNGEKIIVTNIGNIGAILENDEKLIGKGKFDIVIMKYNQEDELEWYRQIGGEENEEIIDIVETTDEGIVVAGNFESTTIELENGLQLSNKGNKDVFIIKYDINGNIEWSQIIGGTGTEEIKSIVENYDGGVTITGKFNSETINLEEDKTLVSNGAYDIMTIKYSNNGNIEWYKNLGGITGLEETSTILETQDNGIVMGGRFSGTIELENGEQLKSNGNYDGMIVKYNENGNLEWARSTGESQDDKVELIIETSDGGILEGISISDNKYIKIIKYDKDGNQDWTNEIYNGTIASNTTVTKNINSMLETQDKGILVSVVKTTKTTRWGSTTTRVESKIEKYNLDGELEWEKVFSEAEIKIISEINDGEILMYSIPRGQKMISTNGRNREDIESINILDFEGNTKTKKYLPKFISSLEKIILTSNNEIWICTQYDGIHQLENGEILNEENSTNAILKYKLTDSADILIEANEKLNGEQNQITSMVKTNDGGYLVVGNFQNNIELNNGEIVETYSMYSREGIIIKYDKFNKVEWFKKMGESIEDYQSNTVTAISMFNNNSYVIAGQFTGTIRLENGEEITSSGEIDTLLIKYNENNKIEWVKTFSDIDNSINLITTNQNEIVLLGSKYKDLSGSIRRISDEKYCMIMKLTNEGEVEWNKKIDIVGEGKNLDTEGYGVWIPNLTINSLISTENGEIIISGTYCGILNMEDTEAKDAKGKSCGIIINYSTDGNISKCETIEDNEIILNSTLTKIKEGYANKKTIYKRGGNITQITKYDTNGKKEWSNNYSPGKNIHILQDGLLMDGGNEFIEKYTFSGKLQWTFNTDNLKNSISTNLKVYEVNNDSIFIIGNNNSIRGGHSEFAKLKFKMPIPEYQELEVENKFKQFIVSTSVSIIEGIAGGTISGGDAPIHEKVTYGESNNKEIKMIPDQDYEIIKVTVNDKEYPFEVSEDGTFTMPQFTDIKEDKHIKVTYALKDNKITINKIDNLTSETIQGTEFKLDQIEERTEPENVVGEIVANGREYIEPNKTEEIEGRTGELIHNTEYYFTKNEDGKIVPNNTGNTGTIAESYIPIDLEGLDGEYVIVVNANISSEYYSSTEYASITETETTPTTYDFINRNYGTYENAEFISQELTGGKKYYLHLNYNFNSEYDNDSFVINSIKLYSANKATYNFENINGEYVSNNKGKANTKANSYIPIDLTECTGLYNLTCHLKISSEDWQNGALIDNIDYGSISISNSTDTPTRVSYQLSGEEENDYKQVLQGGQMYYLHMEYSKNLQNDGGDDTFTVSNIKVELNDSELYHTTVETNSEGKAITQIPFGKYAITEVKSADGYVKLEEPVKIDFTSDPTTRSIIENNNRENATVTEDGEFILENEKATKVIVHHYLKDREGNPTEIKLAEDDILEDRSGKDYSTLPHIDIEKYELEKGIDGEYIIPENSMGQFTTETIEVNYYYVERKIPLTTHHYIEGTSKGVTLEDGTTAQDITESGYEGDNYTTNAIPNEQLSDEYELVEMPTNSTGTYEGNEIEVTYYYRKIQRNVNITKYAEDGQTPLAGAKFTITKIEENKAEDTEPTIYTTDENGKITVELEVGEYEITEIEAPMGYIIPENPTNTIVITRDTTEENLEITNDKIKGKVIVHHYIKGTEMSIKLQDGTIAEDEIKQGYIGNPYATKAKENITDYYEYDSVVGQTSGEFIDGTIEVTYYYRALVDVDVMKKWNHTNNIYGKPENITIELYADGEKIQEITMTAANRVEIEGELENEETWQYTFEKLPKYTDSGIEINYTISEKK